MTDWAEIQRPNPAAGLPIWQAMVWYTSDRMKPELPRFAPYLHCPWSEVPMELRRDVLTFRIALEQYLLQQLQCGDLIGEVLRPGELNRWRVPPGEWHGAALDQFNDTATINGVVLHRVLIFPAASSENNPKPIQAEPKNRGGRPPKYDWAAFDREMLRLANMPDGLPERADLMRYMLDWCARTWGDTPTESVVRAHIAERLPPES